jgi:tetratricopeptide (TPR) repeat protein
MNLLNASGTLNPGVKHAASLRRSIWSTYLMCQSALISRPEKVPLGVWSGLWKVLSSTYKTEYVERMAHIKYLGDDFCKVGVQMDAKQRLLYVESLLVQGDTDIAAELWESLGKKIESSDNAKEYWKLGVNIFCAQGRLDRALQIASVLLKDTQDVGDYRILLPIIQTCLVSQNKFGVQMAWALYIRLRVKLGPLLEMNDYDIITLSFLEVNRPDLALGAFKDMMLRPETPTGQDSTSLYTALTNTKDGLSSIHVSDRELALHNSVALTKLPSRFKNKFFFGSWLKKLIGEGQLDAAQKVLDFTSEMGICPDAKHMNGLIGAFFREGSGKSAILAEDMAWKMINTRLVFVKTRETLSKLEGPLRAVPPGIPDKTDVKRIQYTPKVIPSATIETFCILIQQYRWRQKQEALLDLFDTLRKAEIPPNTDFMNELLNMDSRNHKRDWAWSTYLSLTKAGGVRPNYQTFTVLYGLVCQSLDPIQVASPRQRPKFTTPQQLFAEMMKHKAFLEKDGKAPQELYDAIILAFSLAEDQAGTAVALKALQQHFGTFPSEQTARTIILQLTRLGQTNKAGYKSRRLNLSSRITKERYAHVTKILQRFKQERTEALLEQGIVYEELSEEEKLEEASIGLSDLLRHAFQSKIAPEKRKIYTALEVSKRAAEVMGVPECIPWEGRAVVEVSE